MKNKLIDTRFIARTGIFAAISVILYCVPFLKIRLPIFPDFLEIHFDEIPALIAGFAYGPLSGFFVILIKTLVKLPMTSTMCAGEIGDFVFSLAFIIPSAFMYKKMHTFKGAIISILTGIGIQIIVACFLSTFVMLDIYAFIYNLPDGAILGMCKTINPAITDLGWQYLFMFALPFNLLKDAIVGVVTIFVYKKIHKLIDRIGRTEDIKKEEKENIEKN